MRIKVGKTIVSLVIGFVLVGVAGAESFTDHGNGTVTDGATGLVWQQQDDDRTRSWVDALAYCEGLDFAGRSDWRLPNIRELESIVNATTYNPAIDETDFPNTNSSGYWSSTSGASYSDDAWYVYFHDGHVYYGYRSNGYYVRCVRGGE